MSSLIFRILLAFILAFAPGMCCCGFAGWAGMEEGIGVTCRGEAGRARPSAAPTLAAKSCCGAADSTPVPASPRDGRDCHCHDQVKVAPKNAKLMPVPTSGSGTTIDLVPLGLPLPVLVSAVTLPDASARCFGSSCKPHPPPLSLVAQHCLLLI